MAANAVVNLTGFPVVLRASTLSVCNSAQPAEDAVISAFPAEKLILTVAHTMHCDPQDPEMSTCVVACTAAINPPGTVAANPAALLTFRRYLTAAVRYALLCDADARTNLDGTAAQADVAAGTVTHFTASHIGSPGGCAAGQDAGMVSGDAGTTTTDAGEIGLTDAGEIGSSDAGEVGPSDAGVSFNADAAAPGAVVPRGGCGCSAPSTLAPALLPVALLLTPRRRRLSAVRVG